MTRRSMGVELAVGALSALIIACIAFLFAVVPAHAIYTGSPVLNIADQSLDDWIASLYSDYGRCCDKADSFDPQVIASKTSDSGLAVVYKGQTVDVTKKALHMQHLSDIGLLVDDTNNKAGQAIGWVQESEDANGNPVYLVRCIDLGPLG